MIDKTRFLAFILVILIWLPSAYAREAEIRDVLVAHQGDAITVYARVTDCFTKGMESAIMAGVPTTFTFLLELNWERNFWFDKRVVGAVIRQTIKYDSVKKLFFVSTADGKGATAFQDLESAKRAMAEITGILIIPRNVDNRQRPFYVMIKAKLDKVRLPLYMEYVFFFVSLWDFETDWYRQEVAF
ncbi:MAG: DUF4390 domain-containing protein [Syntrophus sp. (in: bacteria)]